MIDALETWWRERYAPETVGQTPRTDAICRAHVVSQVVRREMAKMELELAAAKFIIAYYKSSPPPQGGDGK